MSFEKLRAFTDNFVNFTDVEFDYITSFFIRRNFKKKEKLVAEGEVEKYLNFVESGIGRLYFMRDKEEIVLDIDMEDSVMCCFESFLTGEPSNFTTEAIEPMTVLSITHSDMQKLYEFTPKMERLGRLFVIEEYLRKARFEYDRVREPMQQRFLNFLKDNGNLLQRVPQKFLASYLDMKPETFSRLKHLTRNR